ncbi:MAG: stalk domain-containing protein [Bacillota bacterium]
MDIDFDVPPVIESGRTLVPLRKIAEALGCNDK